MKSGLRWAIIAAVIVVVLGVIIIKSSWESAEPASQDNSANAVCDTLAQPQAASAMPMKAPASEKLTHLPRFLELGSVGCRPCDMMAPIIAELRQTYAGRLSVEFYDVRKDPAPGREHGIRVIPTQIFIDGNGKEVFRHEGFFPKEEILPILAQMGVK